MSHPSPLTLVFAELAGGAALWARHGEALRPVVSGLLALLRRVAARHGGAEVKVVGDGLLLCFDDPVGAARFGLEAQAGVADTPWPLGPVALRVGAHLGQPVVVHGPHGVDYLGPVVNKAARVAAAAPAGATWVSAELAAALPADLPLRPIGSFDLRGLDGRHTLWQLGAGPPGARPGNLLPRADRFLGRSSELAMLQRSIADGARLLTLLGPGGTGKTRLAAQLAAVAPGFEAAWVIELADVADGLGVQRAIGAALDLMLEADAGAQLDRALDHQGRAIFVLDNLERATAPAAALLSRWLAAAPRAVFVATSRVRLGLPEEQVLEIDPLAPSEAEALFLDRAPGAAADLAAVRVLVAALDGLPLAIELAATRARALPVPEIVARLDQRFRLLTSRGGERPARHATLRACLDGSWEQLSADERRALTQLTLFQGGFSPALAQAALGPGAEAHIEALRNQSLLRQDPATGRYLLLATIREYALLQLDAQDVTAACDSLDRWLADLCSETRIGQTLDPTREDDLRPLLPELDTLVAAVRRRLAAGQADAAARIALLAAHGLKLRGPYALIVSLLGEVLARPDLSPGLRARLLTALGSALYVTGQRDQAQEALEAAIELWTTTGAGPPPVGALGLLGEVLRRGGQPDAGERRSRQALQLAREHGDAVAEAQALANLGLQLHEQRRDAEALPLLEAALVLHRNIGHRRWEASTLNNLSATLGRLERREEAEARLDEALALSRQIGFKRVEASILGSMATEARMRGDLGAARNLYQEAQRLARQIGHVRQEAVATERLAELAAGLSPRLDAD